MAIKKNSGKTRRSKPCALTIAGSDSGGGAGIQADLKTFAAIGIHGTSAITCITAQNPKEVIGIQAIKPEIVRDQVVAVQQEFNPAAIKTGMLYSAAIIRAAADTLDKAAWLIVDPVMVATSGAVLLKKEAISELKLRLFPMADLITPNLHEAEVLLGRELVEPEQLREAARELYERFGCAVLVKGGHLADLKVAIDFFHDGRDELLLEAPYLRAVSTHGTGCTYSAAIAAYCAAGSDLRDAVVEAKQFISDAIAQSYQVGEHFALEPLWR